MATRIFGPSKGNRRPTIAKPGATGIERPTPQVGGGGNKAAGSPEPTVASSTVESISPTGVVTPGAAATSSQREAIARERHERKVQRAEERQRRIVDRYVTKAYSPKQPKASKTGTFSLGSTSNRVREAKSNVASTRKRLLSHPAIQKANGEGKVVGPKGLQKLTQPKNPFGVKGPLSHPQPAQPGEGNRLAKKYPGVTKLEDIESKKQLAAAPSTLEALGYASIGIPGIGIGGDVAKLGQAAAEGIPKILAEGGAKQIAEGVAEKVGAKAAAKIAATKAAPKAAAQAVRDLPQTLRLGVKAAPDALKGAAKAAPKVAGTKTLGAGERTVQGFSGLGLIGGAHKAGVNVPGGAILEGQGKALAKDPLKVLSSTANLAPGLLTGAFQLPVAAGASVVEGSPKPIEGALKEQGNFFKHFAQTYGSSDASKIEKATLEEGLLPEVLAAPLVAKGIKHLGGDALREKVEDVVGSRRAPATDASGNVLTHEHGGPVKKGRLRTGEETRLTRAAERANHRREEAFHAAATNDLTELDFAKRRAEVDKYARKAAGERVPVRKGLGPKGKDTLYARSPDFIPFLVRAGIDLTNPDAAAKEIAHYAEIYKGAKPAHELGASPETLTARDAVRYFTEHPEKLKDKNLAKAVEAYRAMATGEKGLRALSTSERNRYLAYATAHDLPLPEERVPHGARGLTDATTRVGAWEDLKGREKEVRKLRKGAATKREQAKVAAPSRAAKLRREAKDTYAKAKTIEKGRQELLDELKHYTRPWAKANPNAKRIPYDAALEKEFADEARAGLKERGLNPEPGYVPDSTAVMKAAPDQSATGGKKPLEGAPKINEGYVWRNGISRQGYEHLMNEGILRPVSRAYQWEDWRRFRKERGIAYEGAYQHTGVEWQRAFDQGLLNPRDVALVPKQVVNRLEKNVKGGDPTEYEQALAEAMSARKVSPRDAQSGTVYEAYPKAAYDEKVAQSQKSPLSPWIRKPNTITSRAMLSTPSFVGAQLVAETAQAIADVNPARMMQGLHAYSRLTPEQKLRISGVSGETAKAIFSPEDLKTTLGSYESKPFKDSLSFFRRNVFARSAKDIVTMKWAGEVNRATGSFTRRAVLTGQVMRDLNGLWSKGRKLLGVQTEIQKKLDIATKGLHGKARRDAALAYLADNPDVLTHYGKSLNDAMGGWTNLTQTGHFPERYRAALLVFYPFLRMSLQWPLKYAINHPIKATALTYLAAQNNWALKEALHGEPSFLNYAQIPVYGVGKNGATEIINLSRVAPGGNALTEAVQGSGSPIGALQPVLGATITGFTGEGQFGEVEGGTGAHLKAAAGQILGLSPYVRAVDTLRGQKASGQSEFGILAKRANIAAEPLQALEAKLKGSPASQLKRSLANPFEPIPIERARDSAKLGRILQALSANSKDKQNKTEDKATVMKMRSTAEKAENELNALYKKYGLTNVNKLSEEQYNYSHPYPGAGEGIYGKKSATESIYGPASGTGSSIYGEESAPKIPHETSGVHLSLPSIPGLSAVSGEIGSLLGGAKAEAAERKDKAQAPSKEQKVAPKPVRLPFLPTAEQQRNAKTVLNIGTAEHASRKEKLAAIETGLVESYGFKNLPVGDNTTGEPSGGWRQELQTYYPQPTNVKQGAKNFFAETKTDPTVPGGGGETSGHLAQTVQGSAFPERYAEHEKEARKILRAYETGKGITADLSKGKGDKVYVRADAKGMVQWARNAEGTQEGSPKQLRWAANEGLGSSQPWCANFVSNGLARRGVPLPPNPNYVPSYETEWRGGKNIGTDLAKAKPGDLLAFSGEHIGLYVGNGEMISGNYGNKVARSAASDNGVPLTAILRPKYKGGKVAVAAGDPLPGSAFPVGGGGGSPVPAAVAVSTGKATTTATKSPKRRGTKERSPMKRLSEVERIFAGQTPTAGLIPGFESAQASSAAPDLAAIGEAVEKSRRKLLGAPA